MAKGVLGLGGWLLPLVESAASDSGTFSEAYKSVYGRFASERYLIDFLAEKQKCKAQDLAFKKLVLMLKEKKELERHMLGDLAEYKQVMKEYARERKRLDTSKIDEIAARLK